MHRTATPNSSTECWYSTKQERWLPLKVDSVCDLSFWNSSSSALLPDSYSSSSYGHIYQGGRDYTVHANQRKKTPNELSAFLKTSFIIIANERTLHVSFHTVFFFTKIKNIFTKIKLVLKNTDSLFGVFRNWSAIFLTDRALYSDKARSFNQSERTLYWNFIITKHI